MRTLVGLSVVSLLLPLATSAEEFSVARGISFPASISAPRSALLELDAKGRTIPDSAFRIIDSNGNATAYRTIHDEKNLMPSAVFDAVPKAADTIPPSIVEMLRDNNYATEFQMAAQEVVTFRFHFDQEVTPSAFEYDMSSGVIKNVKVRQGLTSGSLRDSFVGAPSGNRIELPRERAKVFEVTLTVTQGVPRIVELRLLEDRSRILFKAERNQQYTLLYGDGHPVIVPYDRNLKDENSIIVTLGAERSLRMEEEGDHDGIDANDNCPAIWNPEQKDQDKDGLGDGCDNCSLSNSDQLDANANGVGDLCDDEDKDSVINGTDNCSKVSNSQQQDEDRDGVGNSCDNSDDRWSAGKPWLLWIGMAATILVLAGVGALILRRTNTQA